MEKKISDNLKNAMWLFMRTDRLHKSLFDKMASNLGIHRGQHAMLAVIARHNGAVTQREIAAEMEITPAAVTVAVKKLEADGYIERREKLNDSRANDIIITKKGRDILEKTKRSFLSIDAAMLSVFSDEELEQFVGYLVRLQNNLEKMENGEIEISDIGNVGTCFDGKENK